MSEFKLMKDGLALTDKDIYHMLYEYMGYGNPAGKYWFIGMEENWGNDEAHSIVELIRIKDLKYYYSKPDFKKPYVLNEFMSRAKKNSNFEGGIKRILKIILEKDNKMGNDDEEINIIEENNLFIANSNFIPINPIENASKIFKDFSIDQIEKDSKSYQKRLFDLWDKNNPELTFCMGKGYEDMFNNIFSNDPNFSFKQVDASSNFMKKGECGIRSVHLLYHPSYVGGFNEEYLKELKSVLYN